MTPVTLRDLARRLGVTPSSVSRALQGDNRVSARLRERAARLADEMGYRPDPAVRALAHYRWGRPDARPAAGRTIAFLTNLPASARSGFAWLELAARELGYHLDVFELGGYRSPAALLRVLRARGVLGVFFYVNDTPPLDLGPVRERYPAVNWNCRLRRPGCPSVVRDAYHRVRDACLGLSGGGHRRVALLLPEPPSAGRSELWEQMLAAWMLGRGETPALLEPIFYRDLDFSAAAAAVKAARPEVVIGFESHLQAALASAGWRRPRDYASFVSLSAGPGERGVADTYPEVARHACDLLNRLIQRRAGGAELAWVQVEVRGAWQER